MTKRRLMLSVAGAALLSSPGFAQTPLNITTSTSTAVTTATACGATTPCDITIGTTGSINITAASPVVTIDSNNTVTNSGSLTNKNTTGAIGLQIDTGFTSNPNPGTGFADLGIIDLSGSGTGKIGIELIPTAPTADNPTPSETYTGSIVLLSSTTTIAGDGSTGILIGQGTTLAGNLDIGGTLTMTPTTTTETTNGAGDGIAAVRIDGTVTGNVTLDSGVITVQGDGAQGFVLGGNITGTLINGGSLRTVGITSTQNPQTGQITGPSSSGDPEGGSAMLIGGSIGGGFLNAGPLSVTDNTTGTATIATQGTAAALRIDPSLQVLPPLATSPTAITIGVLSGDTTDPGYSFYNRGIIQATPIDPDLGAAGISITGIDGAVTTLGGLGFFNSGQIAVVASTDSKGVLSSNGSQGTGAVALLFGNFTAVGDPTAAAGLCGTITMTAGLCNSNETGHGTISATVNGVFGGTATAIDIVAGANLPTLVNLGTIAASASTTEPTTVLGITAYGIFDGSGTLSSITNLGTISATTTTLQDSGQVQRALDLALNTTGVNLQNQGTIVGDVMLGTGTDTVHVLGGIQTPASIFGNISFGETPAGMTDTLFVDSFGTVSGAITEGSAGVLNVHVAPTGTLVVRNTVQSLTANDFIIDTGATALNLTVSSALVNTAQQNIAVVNASDKIVIGDNVNFGVNYASYIPTAGNFILLQAPVGQLQISQLELNTVNTNVSDTVPFLFTSDSGVCGYNLANITQCGGTAPNFSELVLKLQPKTADQLGLTGYGLQLFPYVNAALSTDATLGSGMINAVATNNLAQQAYSQFAPDASGGTRAVAVSLTDQATGPVASRQRALRMYGTQPGGQTLWGEEFAEFLDEKGNGDLPGFKNRGFGFAIGGDGGDPSDGWYGGAFTFYTGGINQQAPEDTHTDTEWYMLTAYTDWRGKGLFLDTNVNVGYGDLSGHRFVVLTAPPTSNIAGAILVSREADSKRGSEMAGAGFTTGVIFNYGGTTLTPQLSVDGLSLREEGYSEANGGPGLDLTVQPYYANSLRAYLGGSARQDIDFGDFYIQPEARLGYRYDIAADAVKLRTDFQSVTDSGAPGTGMFTVIGPDPERGNVVAGATVSATTGTWSMGLNYDFIRGNGGSITQVGTLSLLGRI